jgi:hypothetical protein
MAQEIDDGIAYLRSLKRSVSPLAAAATGPVRETGSDEHSGSARPWRTPENGSRALKSGAAHAIRAKAEPNFAKNEEGCDVGTWATCSDVSLHGCYVEAGAPIPPGPCCP